MSGPTNRSFREDTRLRLSPEHVSSFSRVSGDARVFVGDADPSWGQGRATYGGFVAAAGLRAMRVHVPSGRRPRVIQVSFVGPLPAGPFEVHTRTLRSGRHVTQLQADVISHGSLRAVVLGAFGADRDSALAVAPPSCPVLPEPTTLGEMPFIEGATPVFVRHFEFRWGIGQTPFTGAAEGEVGGYVRFRADQGPMDEEGVAGIMDSWPPPNLPMMKAPAPSSSLTWALEFLQDPSTSDMGDYLVYHGATEAAAQGYTQSEAWLWDASGRAIARGVQTITIFG